MKYLRKLLPGIRAQLTLMTIALVLIMVGVLSLWLMSRQRDSLQRELLSQIEPVLESMRNIILEQNQIEKSLASMEEMRQRIIKAPRSRNYYDTYFSIKHLDQAEKEIKAQLRSADGRTLSEAEASKFINAKRKFVKTRVTKQSELNYNPLNWFSSGLTKEVKKYRRTTQVRTVRDAKKEKSAFIDTVKSESKEKLSLFNFDSSRFRFLAYQKNGSLLFDTRTLETGNYSPVNQLAMNKGVYQKEAQTHLKDILSATKKDEKNFVALLNQEQLQIEDNEAFASLFRNLFANDEISERAALVLQYKVLDDRQVRAQWQAYTSAEKNILSSMRLAQDRLRERRSYLIKEKPKAAPSADEDYRKLYADYASLITQRQNLASEFFAAENEYAVRLKEIKQQIKKQKDNLKDTAEESKALKKQLKQTPKEKKEDYESLEKKITEADDKQESIKDDIQALEQKESAADYRRENWQFARTEFVPDAFAYLSDAVLYDRIQLRFRYDLKSHRDYLRSAAQRVRQQKRWQAIRQWIMYGRDEISFKTSRVRLSDPKPLPSGVLALTRSEAEDLMWELDAQPIGAMAINLLQKDYFSGFLRFTADLADYRKGFAAERNRMRLLLAVVGVLGSVLSWFLAGIFVKRIRRVALQAAQVGQEGNLKFKFPESGWDEITKLQVSLNSMLTQLRAGEELRSQMSAAGEVQRRLLPTEIPSQFSKQLEIAMFYRAMSNVGGDYYDFMPAANGELAFCIGDVSNHGIGPALIMSNLSAQIHLLVQLGLTDPIEILGKLNDLLYKNTPEDMFVTFFLGFVDPKAKTLRYCSAGHNDAELIRAKGTLQTLPGGGLPLGMDENEFFLPSLKVVRANLTKGDLIFHCTDGLVEAKNSTRQMYGIENVRHILVAHHKSPPSEILDTLGGDLAKFIGQSTVLDNLEDDIAMIAIRLKD